MMPDEILVYNLRDVLTNAKLSRGGKDSATKHTINPTPLMRSIILFIFEAFYPSGGSADIAGTFATESEAYQALMTHEGFEESAEILDLKDNFATRYHRTCGKWEPIKSATLDFDARRTPSGN
jgi:hypothetical protein